MPSHQIFSENISPFRINQHVKEKLTLFRWKMESHTRTWNEPNNLLMNGQIAHSHGSWALRKKYIKCRASLHTFLNNKLTFCSNWLIDLINIGNVYPKEWDGLSIKVLYFKKWHFFIHNFFKIIIWKNGIYSNELTWKAPTILHLFANNSFVEAGARFRNGTE